MRHWIHLSGQQLGELGGGTVAICPLGAVESHGPHLPSGTDTMIAEGILDAIPVDALAGVDAVRLPALWLGVSVEHTSQTGTFSTPAARLIEQIGEIAAQVARHGVSRLVLFSAHGGNNAPARIAAHEARAVHGLLCAAPHWMDFGLPDGLRAPTPPRGDAHGGWMETSMMMALAPDTVQDLPTAPSRTNSPAPLLYPNGPVHWGWMSEDLGEDGFIGAPHLASRELGVQLIEHAAQSTATLIRQMAEADWPV